MSFQHELIKNEELPQILVMLSCTTDQGETFKLSGGRYYLASTDVPLKCYNKMFGNFKMKMIGISALGTKAKAREGETKRTLG